MTDDTRQRVWRYMRFSRFVWLLQNKQLWLSRADLLGDPWEIALAGDQLAHVISHHPPTTLPLSDVVPEGALERSERIIRTWRRRTFVSCWSASDDESHALWRVYCGSPEGIAVQTTLGRLQQSVGSVPLYRVRYQVPGITRQTPTLADLVTAKRPMFAYEREVRVVLSMDRKEDPSLHDTVGQSLPWDPETTLETVWVHPDADHSFMEAATKITRDYAPALKDRVLWSKMQARPPF